MCEFCEKDDLESKPVSEQFSFTPGIETIVDDVFLYNYCNCGRHTVLRIHYCPMCGRRLDG